VKIIKPPELTPMMKHLNGSPFYRSEVDLFDKTVTSALWANIIDEASLKPAMSLGCKRILAQDGAARHELTLSILSEFQRYVPKGNEEIKLELIADTTTITLSGRPKDQRYFPGYEDVSGFSGFIIVYEVPEQLIRSIAKAKMVQMQVHSDAWVYKRSLSAINIARFRVFVEAFIDGTYKPGRNAIPSKGR